MLTAIHPADAAIASAMQAIAIGDAATAAHYLQVIDPNGCWSLAETDAEGLPPTSLDAATFGLAAMLLDA
jgi:hypothetical protein